MATKTIKGDAFAEQEKTGSEIENLEKETIKTKSLEKPTGIDFHDEENEAFSSSDGRKSTARELALEKRYLEEARKNKNLANLFATLKWLAVVGLPVLGIYWAYNISSISEPIGGIKKEVEYLREDVGILQYDLKELNNIVRSNNNTTINSSQSPQN